MPRRSAILVGAALILAVACGGRVGDAVTRDDRPPDREALRASPSREGAGVEVGAKGEPKKEDKKDPKKEGPPSGETLAFMAIPRGEKTGRIFVWDEALGDSYAVPAPGPVIATAVLYLDTRILYETPAGQFFSYDLLSEISTAFNDVNSLGFVTRASLTKDARTMVFVANTDGQPKLSEATKAYVWLDGAVAELAKVNAVGALRRGVGRIRIAGGGKLLIFTTLDGGLFLYSPETEVVHEVEDARAIGDGFSHQAVLSADASRMAWASGRTAPRQIVMQDLATTSSPAGTLYRPLGKPRLLEVASGLFGGDVTCPRLGPKTWIYFEALDPALGIFKSFRHDYLADGAVQALTPLNSTIPDESTVYCGTGVP